MQVKELKQYIQWLIDNDLDEYHNDCLSLSVHNDRDYKTNWRYDIINCIDEDIKIISLIDCDNCEYHQIELNNEYFYVIEEYINEWRVINRKQKLERLCNLIDI